MTKTILVTLLLLSSSAFAAPCITSQMSLFGKTPSNEWQRADGHTVSAEAHQSLAKLLADNVTDGQIVLPEMDSVQMDGKTYDYYICVDGYSGVYAPDESYTGMVYRFASPDALKDSYDTALSLGQLLPILNYQAYAAAIYDSFKVYSYGISVPKISTGEQIKNVKDGKLTTRVIINNLFPISESDMDCEEGEVFISIIKDKYRPHNLRVIQDAPAIDTKTSYGQAEAARWVVCERP